jgi:hypothetical protein
LPKTGVIEAGGNEFVESEFVPAENGSAEFEESAGGGIEAKTAGSSKNGIPSALAAD